MTSSDSSKNSPRVRVKICGVTTPEDAEWVAHVGADMLGLNFVPGSKRWVNVEQARRIREVVAGKLEVIGVVADLTRFELDELRVGVGLDALQLHGEEPPELLHLLSANDFKAVRIATAEDVQRARAYRGPRLLVDAKRGEALGGTGHRFDWSLLGSLPRERELILAGGLDPDNVEGAVRSVRPWGVDVASGVERAAPALGTAPLKDAELVERFVAAARRA